LPDNLQTLVISYQYSCDKNLQNCKNKEEFHVAQPYGLVKWQHQVLQADGTYAAPTTSQCLIYSRPTRCSLLPPVFSPKLNLICNLESSALAVEFHSNSPQSSRKIRRQRSIHVFLLIRVRGSRPGDDCYFRNRQYRRRSFDLLAQSYGFLRQSC